MKRIVLFFASLLFAGQSAHATRPEYFEAMWVLAVADVCLLQNPQYRDSPLARSFAQSAPDSAGYWQKFDQRPVAACVKRLEKMPEQVCAAVLNQGLEMDRATLSALRARHEVQAWRAERVLAYVQEERLKGARASCPDAVPDAGAAGKEALSEAAAACRAVPAAPEPDVRELVVMGMADLDSRAAGGDAMAQNELGRRYGLGLRVARDSVKSAEWYARAAAQGLGIAQSNLANMYINGEGVARDPAVALAWATKAADQGGMLGQMTVGFIYANGIGVAKDGRQAERCFLMAARQGSVYAQRTLAQMYSRGEGVAIDKDESVLWFQRARAGELTGKAWKEGQQ